MIKVPQGIVIVEDEESTQDLGPESPQFYYVLEDDSELSGSDIKNPEQNFDPNTQEPIVTMEFTDDGRRRVRERHEADRRARVGADPAARRGPGSRPSSASRSRSTTRSSRWRRSTTSRTRRASTAAPARRSTASAASQDTQDLAENLRIGALPINLKLISKTQVSATLGKQALNEGLIAGGVGLALTLLFLIVFYRVLGALAASR